ncbi:PaaX family transcriptional regulator C-terminal domain-containing protein [Pontiella sp.]|uniref:PaaX family transcriptional regulator C-terminal domain-containing protein n=1 Tax=Pontiella sp. TaxID=2837462 RepID=UPI0035666900
MKWEAFHHPDFSLPVVRRKVGGELVTLLDQTAGMLLSAGACDFYGHCYPTDKAFRTSIARLQAKGLVVKPHTDGTLPELRLTPEGESMVPDYFNPERRWNKAWNHWWYVLMFDVPEKERSYRDKLRGFLKRLHFGCLQKSVWITPRDIRPEYDDLDHAANVESVAHLFEARTVLGHGNESVVREAWDFDALREHQAQYNACAEKNLSRLAQGNHQPAELAQLMRMDNLAYSQAMANDPLLPNELLPGDYLGKEAHAHHRALLRQVIERS